LEKIASSKENQFMISRYVNTFFGDITDTTWYKLGAMIARGTGETI